MRRWFVVVLALVVLSPPASVIGAERSVGVRAVPPTPTAERGPGRPAVGELCPEGGPWLNVYRYTVNVSNDLQTPVYETHETFDGQRFPTEEAARCAARRIRREGVDLPTLGRFGRDSNVMPESITPMPSLQTALDAGAQPAR